MEKIYKFLGKKLMKWCCCSEGKLAKLFKQEMLIELKQGFTEEEMVKYKLTESSLAEFIAEFEKEHPDMEELERIMSCQG